MLLYRRPLAVLGEDVGRHIVGVLLQELERLETKPLLDPQVPQFQVSDLAHAHSVDHAASCGTVAVDLQVAGPLGLDQVSLTLKSPGSRTACGIHLGFP